MKNTVFMSDLHFDHKMWERQLKFQKGELEFFRDRLAEVAERWTDEKVLQQVEHFQNSFIIHSNKIDELQHDINIHEDELVARVKENPIAIDHVHFADHTQQRTDIETQWKLYNDLKDEYLDFLRMAM
jgi:hypothetical protein